LYGIYRKPNQREKRRLPIYCPQTRFLFVILKRASQGKDLGNKEPTAYSHTPVSLRKRLQTNANVSKHVKSRPTVSKATEMCFKKIRKRKKEAGGGH
jgi:hypothetical protein